MVEEADVLTVRRGLLICRGSLSTFILVLYELGGGARLVNGFVCVPLDILLSQIIGFEA